MNDHRTRSSLWAWILLAATVTVLPAIAEEARPAPGSGANPVQTTQGATVAVDAMGRPVLQIPLSMLKGRLSETDWMLITSNKVADQDSVLYHVYVGRQKPFKGIILDDSFSAYDEHGLTGVSFRDVGDGGGTPTFYAPEYLGPACPQLDGEGVFYKPSYEPPPPLAGRSGQDVPIENLIFSGGGILGLAYGGSAKAMEEAGVTAGIKRYAGSSAGAINATLLAIGFTADQMSAEMKTVNFGKFLDSWTDKVDVEKVILELMSGTFDWWDLANYWRIAMMAQDYWQQKGMCKGDAFRLWLVELMKRKGFDESTTFAILHERTGKELNITLCDVHYARTVIANHVNTPNLRIVDAVRASMSIPAVFSPLLYNSDLYVDGGTMYPYPVDLFDRTSNWASTMGFILLKKEAVLNPVRADIKNTLDFTLRLKDCYVSVSFDFIFRREAQNEKRTVFIDTFGVSPMAFSLTDAQKEQLYQSGYKATKAYLQSRSQVGSEPLALLTN